MKILDIDSLPILNRDLYLVLYKESINEINSLCAIDDNDFISTLSFSLTPFLSRDPNLTNVVSLNTKFKLLLIELNKYKIDEVIIKVDNVITKKCLCNYLIQNEISKFKICKTESVFVTYFNLIKESFSAYLSFFFKLFKILIFKFFSTLFFKNESLSKKKAVIIETFYLVDSIKNRKITDRYHTNEFYKSIKLSHFDHDIYILPEINFGKLNIFDIFYLKKTYPQSLLKYDFLTYFNFLEIVYLSTKLFFNINFLLLSRKRTKYLYNKILWENLTISPKLFIHLQDYFVVKYFKEKHLEITSFYDWWENQCVDKILNLSFSKLYTATNRIGVISYIVDMDINNQLYPTITEFKLNLIPKTFLIWSSHYGNIIRNKAPFFQFIKYNENRFSYLNNIKPLLVFNNLYILVMMPIDTNTSLFILQFITDFVNENPSYKFYIKVHPANSKIISNIKFNENIILHNKNLNESNNDFKIVVSSNSSASMETILSYKFLILVSPTNEFNNSLNNLVPSELYKNVQFYNDFKLAVLYFSNRNILNDLNTFKSVRDKILIKT